MRKLQIEDAEIMRLAVQDEILRSEESRYDHRLHGILLFCSGRGCLQSIHDLASTKQNPKTFMRNFIRHYV